MQQQAVPFTKADLHQCIEALDLETLEGRRTQVVLVFGFRMFSRREVLSALRFTDITETANGLDVHVRSDKTDKDSEGRVCSLPPLAHPDSDPVRVFYAWRDQLAAGYRETATMLAAVVLVALVLLAGVSGETGLWGAIGLSIAAVAWFLVNGPMEGPILVVVSDSNGLTGADLAGVAALALAIWRGRVALRHRGRR